MATYTNTFLNIITIVGIIDTVVLIYISIKALVSWFTGVSPVLYRLGFGLARRKIAIFAKGDNLKSLQGLLVDAKIFNAKNICEITDVGDIGRAEKASVYLVYWSDWSDNIKSILDKKPDSCALVIYAPLDKGRIPEDQMKEMDGKRHTAVSNFRGRLLNDIVTSMITTSYEKN